MRKKVVVLLILGLFLVPSIASARGQGKGKHKAREFNQQLKTKRKAHGEQQRSENKAFRETIKDMDVDQRAVAIKGHRQTQHQGNVDFHESMHAERAERLKERFNNPKIKIVPSSCFILIFPDHATTGIVNCNVGLSSPSISHTKVIS